MSHANGTPNGAPLNGHPKGPTHAVAEEESDQTNENIFLFVPNLIGSSYHCMRSKMAY